MNVVRISLVVFVVALAASPRLASAQWWGGGGGHHHHDAAGHRVDDSGHHIDNHGNHTGSWGVHDGDHSNELHYNYSPSYYTPSYSGQRTTYYGPSASIYVSPNVLPRPAQPTFRGEPIEIKCPANLEGSVNYALNGYKYTMRSGQSQTIQSDRAWTVTFDRGNDLGVAKYSLSPGTYEFSVSEKGWELQKQRPSQPKTVDAPAPPAPTPPADTLRSVSQ